MEWILGRILGFGWGGGGAGFGCRTCIGKLLQATSATRTLQGMKGEKVVSGLWYIRTEITKLTLLHGQACYLQPWADLTNTPSTP